MPLLQIVVSLLFLIMTALLSPAHSEREGGGGLDDVMASAILNRLGTLREASAFLEENKFSPGTLTVIFASVTHSPQTSRHLCGRDVCIFLPRL